MRTAPVLVLALAVVLGLGACVADAPVVSPEESPSVAPIFASDEEALAAAEEALVAYYEVSDQIISDGGSQPDRLETVATKAIVERELAGYSQLMERGWRGVGETAFDSLELQQHAFDGEPGEEIVTVYVCVDISQFNLVDSAGESVSPADRSTRSPFEAGFTLSSSDAETLVLSRKDLWTGDDFCALS